MIIENNGISIDINRDGSRLSYKINDQSNEFTRILRFHGHVRTEAGYSLRTNQKPSFNKKLNRFFVRGSDKEGHDNVVEIKFKNAQECQTACENLIELISKVVWPEEIKEHNHNIGQPEPGGTTYVRFAIITNQQAIRLNLTAQNYYPLERTWKPCKPIFTENRHYNEHIAQAVDVLNKAHGKGGTLNEAEVVNAHKVTNKQAADALAIIRNGFDQAEKSNCLVAFWRLVTGIRGPDFLDMSFLHFKDLLCLLLRKKKDPKKTRRFLEEIIEIAQNALKKL